MNAASKVEPIGDTSGTEQGFQDRPENMKNEIQNIDKKTDSPALQKNAVVNSSDKGQWVDSDLSRYPLEGGFDGAERDWNALSRQVWQLSRITALFLLFAMLVGWPLGDYFAHRETYGTGAGWSLLGAYPAGIIMFALVVPALIIFSGYVLSRAMTTTQAAEAMASAARAYSAPDSVALQEIETVGTAVRTQMDGLNAGLDTALSRLADAEAMIRKHVEAIETAGDAIEMRATGALERVATERSRLIDATENLNQHADGFANAIAERTEANIVAMDRADDVSQKVEAHFDERLGDLEKATTTALDSFRELLSALSGADENVKLTAGALKDATDRTVEATEKTRAATVDAHKAAEEAVQQALVDATSEANIETAKQAVAEASEKAKEEALSMARKEASEIARTAIESAGLEIEQFAKDASETVETQTKSLIEQSQEVADAAAARNKELTTTHKALEEENSRLEKLIEEQKARADRLAKAISDQSEKLAKLAESTPEVEEIIYPNNTTENNNMPTEQPLKAAVLQSDSDIVSKSLRLRFPDNRKQAASEKNAGTSEHNEYSGMAVEEAKAAFAPAVKNPREDLQRLDELARDLKQSRSSATSIKPVQHASNIEDSQNTVDLRQSAKRRENPSWKEILAAADGAEPLDLGTDAILPLNLDGSEEGTQNQTPKLDMEDVIDLMPDMAVTEAMILGHLDADLSERELRAFKVIHRLQQFTLNLDQRLYGACPRKLLERFDGGDRNIFANRLLRLNEADVKKRIRSESAGDRKFEADIREFLKEFDGLLEEAAHSPSVDEELREYLSSPLGRIYLLIGEIVGYFA